MRTTAHLILCLLGCLVLSPWLEGAKTKDCPKDWLRYQGSCYGFFPQKITWAEAEAACQKQGHGAHLASILSSSATEVIAGYISSHYPDGNVWIGLHDPRHSVDMDRWLQLHLQSLAILGA
ncbi:regenerating islet-derived protein 4-like [Alligator mississippiensis]|uniref:Regenerating islet-derived protein 4-like n=1 Tax=Alligator mississippiensis TaxID=8496 RepID=A0A151NA02_ALLMI|nr:regenerating islet-derived protein 4-like [Alligator mississippiensis]